ncbi:MAG: family 78 glycoside hydrolase catalytic domain [Terrimicrobiaceae bacterium]
MHALFPGAKWIGANIFGSPRTSAPAPHLRKAFHLGQAVRSATLTVTALGLYECEVNGRRVGDEVFAPGWTDYRRRVQYQTHDVAGMLGEGENVLGAILGDGWYCGFVGMRNRQYYGERPQFLARLEVVLQDGSTVSVATDASWKTSAGPIMEADMLMGEVYDARRELGGWSQPGYDDTPWLPAVVGTPGPVPELSPRLGPPVRRVQELRVMKVDPERNIHDFGQNFAGRVRLKVRAERGRVIKLRFAEVLGTDGSLFTENLREARSLDCYICKGGGEEVWEPRFTFHGFRYVGIGGATMDDAVELTGIVLHSDTPPTGSFRCSHELLNQLQSNIQWGQKSNFLEVPMDCPQRDERLGWTGDAQVFCRTAAFNMDVAGFFHKWMRDLRDAQTAEGGIPPVIPPIGLEPEMDADGGPAWADAAIICPWTVYLCYGDRSILEENYDAMRRFMDFIAARRCLGGIRSHPKVDPWGGFGDWLAMDGSGGAMGSTPKDLIGTAYYACDAEIMEQIATLLGRAEEAARYRALRGEITEAFQRRFVTLEGMVYPGTQTAYILALRFGLLPETLRAPAAAELVSDIRRRGCHLATGFVGTPYILQVLEEAGYLDVAYKLLEQESCPSWLFPVKNGATTIWERWDGCTPEKGPRNHHPYINSFNHYANGAVGAWLYTTVAGLELDPAEPGYRHIIFRPRPGGSLSWAEASLQTHQGEAGIRWDLDGKSLRLTLKIPAGSRATLDLPSSYRPEISRFDAGTYQIVAENAG